MPRELDYLILAAHPDDAELHCGGTILKMAQLGYQVGVLDLTRGEAATSGTVEERQQETARANELLQIGWRHNLALPDSGLQDTDQMRRPIVDLIRRHRPKILIAPPPVCRHPDHVATHYLARSVHFFSGAGGFPSAEKPFRPWQLYFHLEAYDERPDFVIDITDQWDAKQAAIAAYGSQFASGKTLVGSSQFHHMMAGRAAHFGGQIGAHYGEAYLSPNLLRIDDPLSIEQEARS